MSVSYKQRMREFQHDLPFAAKEEHLSEEPYTQRFIRLLSGDLGFHGQRTAYSTHTWHAFPAKFPPQLPEVFIRELTTEHDVVFDPMMGSGTTLIEAVRSGRKAVGCDIDPLSLRIVPAKLTPINPTEAAMFGKSLVGHAQKMLQQVPAQIELALKDRFDGEEKAFLDYWFAPSTQMELMALLMAIEAIPDPGMRGFFTLVFSSVIITKSGGVSLAMDLAHTRPHKVAKQPNSALSEFRKRYERNLQAPFPDEAAQFMVCEANAKQLPLADCSVDLIVTSPPYANHAIDYMRAHKFSLIWLNCRLKPLTMLRQKYIGSDSVRHIHLPPLPEYAQGIVRQLHERDSKKGPALHRYYAEMTDVLAEMYRILKPGKAAVVVVGTSVLRGLDVETQTCLGEIGQQIGFQLVQIGIRQLDRDKRMLPARWNKSTETQIETRMHDEYVIGFLKPPL